MGLKDNHSAFDSREYDRKIRQTVPYYEEFYRQVIALLNIHRKAAAQQAAGSGSCQQGGCGLYWLDAGCGTGKMAEAAFSNMDIERFVFADSSEDMIKTARERFASAKAEFRVCDILELSYREEFDVVTAIQVNHYFQREQKLDVLKNYYSACKSNGIYIGFENFAPYTQYGTRLGLEKWKAYQLNQGKSAREVQEHSSRFGVQYFPVTLSEHLELLKQAGFDAAEIFWVSNLQAGVYGVKN